MESGRTFHVEWMISQYEDGVLTDWTLTISGKGAMPNFRDNGTPACPWENEKQKIKKVIIEKGVTNIGGNAFKGCINLAAVHIPKTVERIEYSAFQGCTALTKIDIPNSVIFVGSSAFAGCRKLQEVHTHWKDPKEIIFGHLVFYELGDSWPGNRTIYVPAGYKDRFVSGAWVDWKVEGEDYTVSFDGGNASGSMESVRTSGNYILPESGFTYDTADFEYWTLERSDGERAGSPGEVFPVTEDVTLYANWILHIVIPDPDPPVEECTHEWGEWTSNGNGTHTRTCSNNSSHTETGDCSGGTATCTEKAVCKICNTAYGELNASNHTGGTEVRGRVEATTSADGYTGDTYCKGCKTKIATGESIPKKDSGDSPSGGSSSGGSSSSSGGGGGGGTTYYTLTFETNGGDSIQAIRAARGKTLDLSAYTPMRDGYDFGGWYADKDLTQRITEIKLSGSKTVYADWKKREPDAVKNPFADVNAGDWFYRDVLFSYEKGLMSGMDAAAFAPYANTTRAQIAVIFYRMEGSPAVEGENSFTDVVRGSGTAWFYDAVTWAQQNGIMGGYDNSSFAPNDPITREQLAAIFYRYAQYKGYDTTQGGMAIREFGDYESISDYAMSAMAWAVNTGLVKGDSNLLYPNGTATRAEIAAMLHRFVENGMK